VGLVKLSGSSSELRQFEGQLRSDLSRIRKSLTITARGWESALPGGEKPADPVVVCRGSDDATENRSDDGDPEDQRAVGQAIILEPGNYREQSGTEIARRVDGIAVQPAKSHTYHDNHQSDK
jgi:hypothetical protein